MCSEKLKRCKKIPCFDKIEMVLSANIKDQRRYCPNGRSSLIIFKKLENLKYKYGNRHFWCRGYYVDTVDENKKEIEEYIKNQQNEDMVDDQISIKEYTDSFEGGR